MPEKINSAKNKSTALITIILLILLAAAMLRIYAGAARREQDSDSAAKLMTAITKLKDYEKFYSIHIASFDVFSHAKTNTVALWLNENNGNIDADIISKKLGLEHFCVTDKDNNVIFSHELTPTEETIQKIASIGSSKKALETEHYRYYSSQLNSGGRLICGYPMSDVRKKIGTVVSIGETVGDITVGTTGFIVVLDKETKDVLYAPDSSLAEKDATELGIRNASFEDGFDGSVKFSGKSYFCKTKGHGEFIVMALVPWSELVETNVLIVAVVLLIIAFIIFLVTTYVHIIKKETDTDKSVCRKIGENFSVNMSMLSRVKNVVICGLAVILVFTYYVQSVVWLAREGTLFYHKLNTVTELIDEDEESIARMRADYEKSITRLARDISVIVRETVEFTDEDASEVARAANVYSVQVFDKNGIRTASSRSDDTFAISRKKSADATYALWNVVRGNSSSVILNTANDSSLRSDKYTAYAVQGGGCVVIGTMNDDLDSKYRAQSIGEILKKIAVDDSGFLFATLKKSQDKKTADTIAYWPGNKYKGELVSERGLSDNAMKDGYSGIQTLDGIKYFIRGMDYDEYRIYITAPISAIYAERNFVTLMTFIISALMLLILIAPIVARRKDEAGDIREKAEVAISATENYLMRKLFGDEQIDLDWQDKTPEQKLIDIATKIVAAFTVLFVIYSTFFRAHAMKYSLMDYILSRRWETGFNIFSITYAIIVVTHLMVITWIVRMIILKLLSKFGQRADTIGHLASSSLKYASIVVAIFVCLGIFGVDTKTLVSSAGVISLIIGFGSQKLIGDIVSGIFIVFEGSFQVGDIVMIGDWRGIVIEIGIRTTKIQDDFGDIKIISNSSISEIVNMTKEHSIAVVYVGIDYSESIDRVEAVLEQELPRMRYAIPSILGGPYYKGVSKLDDSSVVLLITAECRETERLQTIRDINREIKLIFDKNNITIPFPQVTISKSADFDGTALKKDKNI